MLKGETNNRIQLITEESMQKLLINESQLSLPQSYALTMQDTKSTLNPI